ncbi:MAG: SagB/ThcOx family dehydrogenase, partial [Desulfobacterales bacterium]|nr:SagB/ThcOx family dehydrogenase [Desulfobacterales bacterium]
ELPGPETRPFELQSMKDYGVLRQIHTSGIPVQEVSGVKRREITGHLPVATLDIASQGLKEKAQKTPVSRMDELGRLLTGRRSRRNFTASPVSRDALRVLAEWLGKGVDAGDRVAGANILETGMVCRNLEGLEDGFYLFDRGFTRIRLMEKGQLAPHLAGVCLDQAWISRAAITFLFFADLNALEIAFGPRGYRYMMMHAGRLGQQIYLGAESLGFGCCGIGAIYDGEAARLFDLSRDAALVYGVATGPVEKRDGFPG